MQRRTFMVLVGAAAGWPLAAPAQQKAIPVIGVLVPDAEMERAIHLFRQGLRDLGYVEGKNIHLEIRSADGDYARLPELVVELVRGNVDIIVPISTPAALAAKRATGTIPIVMVTADPVGSDIVASLVHPGGNITGMSAVNTELGGKLVEFLRDAISGLGRIAALLDELDPFSQSLLESIRRFGSAQGIEIVPFAAKAGPALDAAFAAMADQKVGAAIVQGSLPMKRCADLAIGHRLPTGSPRKIFTLNGGLISYSQNGAVGMRRIAVLVDKILKGAKPADLPVEQPTKFELVINMKTAKALGLTVPPSLLARADEVIE